MHVGKVQTYIPDKVHTLSSIGIVAVNVLVRQPHCDNFDGTQYTQLCLVKKKKINITEYQ